MKVLHGLSFADVKQYLADLRGLLRTITRLGQFRFLDEDEMRFLQINNVTIYFHIKLIQDLLSDCREEDLDLLCRYSLNNLILEPAHSLYALNFYLKRYSYNYYHLPKLGLSSLGAYIHRDKAELFDSRLSDIWNRLSNEKQKSIATSATIFAVAGSFGAQYIQYIKNGGRTSSSGMHHISQHQHQLNKFLEKEKVLHKLKRGITVNYNYKRTGLAVWSTRKLNYNYKTKTYGKKGANPPIPMKIKVSIKNVQLSSGHEVYILIDRKNLPHPKKIKLAKELVWHLSPP